MPIFGKQSRWRASSAKKRARNFKESKVVRRLGGKRGCVPREKWGITSTPIQEVETNLKFPIRRIIGHMVSENREKKTKAVVLDWGCGDGTAIEQIAEEFPDAECFGYSADSYKEFFERKHSIIIQGIEKDIPRYLKGRQIDLVYSHVGLRHLTFGTSLLEELQRLRPMLKKGGKIVFEILKWQEYEGVFDRENALEISGYHVELIRDTDANSHVMVLTKE